MSGKPSRPNVVAGRVGLLAAIIVLPWMAGTGCSRTGSATEAESLAAWQRVAAVLQHPRCLNCHQVDSPLQGDVPRTHVPRVVRGPDDHGVSAMRCGNCHNQMGNNPTAGTPGAPHWQLAPLSMNWQGLSVGELCRMLKDTSRNGHRSPEALIEHMERDMLVRWGWQPGEGREPVPIAHGEFVEIFRTWVAGGTACPPS